MLSLPLAYMYLSGLMARATVGLRCGQVAAHTNDVATLGAAVDVLPRASPGVGIATDAALVAREDDMDVAHSCGFAGQAGRVADQLRAAGHPALRICVCLVPLARYVCRTWFFLSRVSETDPCGVTQLRLHFVSFRVSVAAEHLQLERRWQERQVRAARLSARLQEEPCSARSGR